MKKSEDRMFQSWSMGYLEESPFDRTVNQLFSMLEESFSPYFKDVDKLIDLRLKLAFDFLARRNLVTDFLSSEVVTLLVLVFQDKNQCPIW